MIRMGKLLGSQPTMSTKDLRAIGSWNEQMQEATEHTSKDGAGAPHLGLRCVKAVVGVMRMGHIAKEDGIKIKGLESEPQKTIEGRDGWNYIVKMLRII